MYKKINVTYEPSKFYKYGLFLVMFLIISQFIDLDLNFRLNNPLNYLWSVPILLIIDITYQYFTKQLKIEFDNVEE